ncbi:hypothetical protein [Gymnodinialimonas ulvae]|uniref:hypothetical protein n=1 Tax=Gymnodinialimonas ulvae TaxID=3126504 RepID=UPI00309DF3B6
MSLNNTTPNWSLPADGHAPSGEARSIVTVCVPELLQDNLPRHILAPAARVRHVEMGDLYARDLIGGDAPDLVLSPLSAPDFDVIDLAVWLERIGFAGRYLVLAVVEMPDIPLIRAELAAATKRLNIDIVALGEDSTLHEV